MRIGGFRLVEHALIEIRIADHRPRDALFCNVHRRLLGEQRFRSGDGARIILGRVQFSGGLGQDLCALWVGRKRLRELQRAVDRLQVLRGLRFTRQGVFLLPVGDDRRVPGSGRLLVLAVVVGRAFVFLRGVEILLALEQRVGEQVVGDRRTRIIRP